MSIRINDKDTAIKMMTDTTQQGVVSPWSILKTIFKLTIRFLCPRGLWDETKYNEPFDQFLLRTF